jgi:uncharacterized membrane protein
LAEDRPLSTDQPHGKIRRVAGRSAHAHRHSRASDWRTDPHARAILWLVAILAVAVVTGLSNDEAATLGVLGSRSSVAGLLLCGAVVGALGVLNDVTCTQSSSVFELAAGDPLLPRRKLFASAIRIGRDHIASTVYSLVLACANSALPLLLLFSITGQSVSNVLTSDALGPEIAASLIGATALVSVVPLTTAIAAFFAHDRKAIRAGAGR